MRPTCVHLTVQWKQFYCKQAQSNPKPKSKSKNGDIESGASSGRNVIFDEDQTSEPVVSNKLTEQNAKEEEEERKSRENFQRNLMIQGAFEHVTIKNRDTFTNMVKMFEQRSVHRRNHVEFIYAALKNMKSFGVNREIAVYKALIDVMPKGKFIPTNMFQQEFMHYPKQQQCIIDLLEQMEENGKYKYNLFI